MNSWNDFLDSSTTAELVIGAICLAALAAFASPLVVSSLGLVFVRFKVIPNPSLAEPDGTDPDYADRFDAFADLGFRPAGLIREIVWLNGYEVRKSHTVRFLASEDGRTFAALYRLGFGPGGILRTTLYSITDTGILIQTASPGVELTVDEADYHRIEGQWQDEAGCLDVHRQHVAEVAAKRGGTPAAVGLDGLAAIDERTSRRTLRQINDTSLAKLLLGVGWAAPFAATLVILAVGSEFRWPTRLAISLLIATVGYTLLAYWIAPMVLRIAESGGSCCGPDGSCEE